MARSRKKSESIVITSWNLLHGQLIPPNPQNLVTTPQKAKQLLTTAGSKLRKSLNDSAVVLALQECDFNQPRSTKINQIQLIGQGAKLKNWVFVPTLIGTPGERWQKIKQPSLLTNLESLNSKNKNIPMNDLQREKLYGIGFATNQKIKQVHIKNLGRSRVGLPLIFPSDQAGKSRVRLIYVRDEPRIAIALELENGITVINTHLSFVPFVNWYQLNLISRWAKRLPGEKILVGDLNLPANLPNKLSRWKSLVNQKTYPSWKPGIQFDYIMARCTNRIKCSKIASIKLSELKISDHIPISAQIELSR
jgi:endonuclease/exonuclease/phosphatase family metal-dependent hydrolase